MSNKMGIPVIVNLESVTEIFDSLEANIIARRTSNTGSSDKGPWFRQILDLTILNIGRGWRAPLLKIVLGKVMRVMVGPGETNHPLPVAVVRFPTSPLEDLLTAVFKRSQVSLTHDRCLIF
jgi:hypothetical protein